MMGNSDRLPPIPQEKWTQDQRRYAQEIIAGPRGQLIAPFIPLMRSAELMGHAQRMGEYLRYRSAIGHRLSELAILIVAHQWNQQVEWAIHAPIAMRAGISEASIESLKQGREPTTLLDDEVLVYQFCRELQATQQISDKTWNDAVGLLGDKGIIDLLGIVGYYTFLAMVMNAARTPFP